MTSPFPTRRLRFFEPPSIKEFAANDGEYRFERKVVDVRHDRGLLELIGSNLSFPALLLLGGPLLGEWCGMVETLQEIQALDVVDPAAVRAGSASQPAA